MGLATALDPARDLQRLNTLIITHMDGLVELADTNNGSAYSKEPTVQDDPAQVRKTIGTIKNSALDLQKTHHTYKMALEREMKIGSRQAPIGDDNYLHITRNGLGAQLTSTMQQYNASIHHHNHHQHHSPTFFNRNQVLRNSFNNEKLSQYWRLENFFISFRDFFLEFIWAGSDWMVDIVCALWRILGFRLFLFVSNLLHQYSSSFFFLILRRRAFYINVVQHSVIVVWLTSISFYIPYDWWHANLESIFLVKKTFKMRETITLNE